MVFLSAETADARPPCERRSIRVASTLTMARPPESQTSRSTMPANDSFHIAVIAGDGIGPEVMAPALEVLRRVEAAAPGLRLRFSETPAGAVHYRETGTSLPESTIRLCEQADAILLGACGLPEVRYPDNTEIMPQAQQRPSINI